MIWDSFFWKWVVRIFCVFQFLSCYTKRRLGLTFSAFYRKSKFKIPFKWWIIAVILRWNALSGFLNIPLYHLTQVLSPTIMISTKGNWFAVKKISVRFLHVSQKIVIRPPFSANHKPSWFDDILLFLGTPWACNKRIIVTK